MQMHDGLRIFARHVHGAVDAEASGVHFIVAGHDDVAFEIDLDQIGGGDLVEHQAIGIDQKMMFGPRHARRQMGEDHVGPAVVVDQAIGGRQIDPHLPFLGADATANILVMHCV